MALRALRSPQVRLLMVTGARAIAPPIGPRIARTTRVIVLVYAPPRVVYPAPAYYPPYRPAYVAPAPYYGPYYGPYRY